MSATRQSFATKLEIKKTFHSFRIKITCMAFPFAARKTKSAVNLRATYFFLHLKPGFKNIIWMSTRFFRISFKFIKHKTTFA